MTKILLMPGPSAAGRDFLLEQLLRNPDVVTERIGNTKPVKIAIVVKTTDRPARTTELTKKSISEEEFTAELERGEIIADYVLESNGKRYGYRIDAFNPQEADVDVMVADASVYQVPEIKGKLGDRVHTAAMIASRDYREKNLRKRGSENEEEIVTRLNLGDAHVALLMMMSGDPNVTYHGFIHPELAGFLDELREKVKAGEDTSEVEQKIEAFSRSRNVVDIALELVREPKQYIDHMAILGEEHRADDPNVDITTTKFFDLGVEMIRRALGK